MTSTRRATRDRRLTVAAIIAGTAATLLMFGWTIFPTLAVAGTTTTWTGNGSDNLPCSGNEHWVLSPAKGITSAVLRVRGVDYTMHQNGQGSFAVDTNVGVNAGDIGNVTATYEGNNEKAFIKLSDCNTGTTTTTKPPTTTTKPPTTTVTVTKPTTVTTTATVTTTKPATTTVTVTKPATTTVTVTKPTTTTVTVTKPTTTTVTTTKPPTTITKTTTVTKTTTTKAAAVLASFGFPGGGPGAVLAGLSGLLILTLILRLASSREEPQ
jgi:hypothetical protein